MKLPVYYLSICMLIACMWQSCSNEEAATLQTDKTKDLSMHDVLQKYLDAGFKIDSTAIYDGEDSFDTPEEALEFLELYLKEKQKLKDGFDVLKFFNTVPEDESSKKFLKIVQDKGLIEWKLSIRDIKTYPVQ